MDSRSDAARAAREAMGQKESKEIGKCPPDKTDDGPGTIANECCGASVHALGC